MLQSKFYHFPNAIYIDAVDYNGTIRVGTEVFCPEETGCPNRVISTEAQQPTNVLDTRTARYAYSYTLILANLRLHCVEGLYASGQLSREDVEARCAEMDASLERKRAMYPLSLWEDSSQGRLTNWPPRESLY